MERKDTGSIKKKKSKKNEQDKSQPHLRGDMGTNIQWHGGNFKHTAMKMGTATFGAVFSHNQDSTCPCGHHVSGATQVSIYLFLTINSQK